MPTLPVVLIKVICVSPVNEYIERNQVPNEPVHPPVKAALNPSLLI